jgi:hypothetical protein
MPKYTTTNGNWNIGPTGEMMSGQYFGNSSVG